MLKEQNVNSSRGAVPPGYAEVLYWRLSDSTWRVILINVLALLSLVPWGAAFFGLAVLVGQARGVQEISTLVMSVSVFVGIPAAIILHELVHGIMMRIAGGRPKYGVMLRKGMFYATAPGFAFRRNRYVAILLAPLIILSLLAVLGMAVAAGSAWIIVVAIFAIINATGAAGDLWITALVLRYPAHAYLIDEQDGMRVFLPKEAGEATS